LQEFLISNHLILDSPTEAPESDSSRGRGFEYILVALDESEVSTKAVEEPKGILK
jgi:hypothetical protein